MQSPQTHNTPDSMHRNAPKQGTAVLVTSSMNLRSVVKRLWLLAGLLFATLFGATVGYVVIEDFNWLDALYMAVVTLSTVGFEEVRPLSDEGRMFTIFVILGGVGAIAFAATTLGQYIITGELRGALASRRMDHKLHSLTGHHIVAGYGRTGHEAASQLLRDGRSVVVIEVDPDEAERVAEDGRYTVLRGDAGNDDVLREAGIERANGLIACVAPESSNLMVVLSARALNPNVQIVARSDTDETRPKLITAGANRVLSLHNLTGRRLAHMSVMPTVVDFLDMVLHDDEMEMWLEDLTVEARSHADGLSIRDMAVRDPVGASILGLRHENGEMRVSPSPDVVLQPGDIVVALGTREQLDGLGRVLTAG
ncbi:MAG: potassium channel protein [Chloroflexi bacterium]|nr:potassium channel protein [Chloroflexota bacterium]